MAAKEDFEAAYGRLLMGKPKICDKGDPINIANVAKEAGRTRSALRTGRGYENLIEKIKSHSESNGEKRTAYSSKKEGLQGYVAQLERENSMLKSQNMSLVLRLYRLEKQLKDTGIKPPSNLGDVVDIRQRFENPEDFEW